MQWYIRVSEISALWKCKQMCLHVCTWYLHSIIFLQHSTSLQMISIWSMSNKGLILCNNQTCNCSLSAMWLAINHSSRASALIKLYSMPKVCFVAPFVLCCGWNYLHFCWERDKCLSDISSMSCFQCVLEPAAWSNDPINWQMSSPPMYPVLIFKV